MQDVGEKIRIQRVIKKYSQEYMAFMLDISQPAYSKIERDETELTISRIYEIAEILEISPFTLLPPPKHGSSIALRYYKTIAKLRRFWNKSISKKLRERKEAYDMSQGQ